MATYFYTTGDQLPYPGNINEAANVPLLLQDNANAVQIALNKRVPTTRKVVAGNGLTQNRTDLASDMTMDIAVGSGLAISADSVDVNWNTLNTIYSSINHNHSGTYQPAGSYAAANHAHAVPTNTQLGIQINRLAVGTLTAGNEKSVSGSKGADQYVFVSVSHTSTYIYAVVSAMTSTGYTIDVRNGTASTDHSSVYINVLKVRSN